jgi:hypothetical protein
MSTDQSHLALSWLVQLSGRARAERHRQRSLILDYVRRIRQKEASLAYEEMERLGRPRVPGEIKDSDIAF